MPSLQLSQLIDTESPDAVWHEIQVILGLISAEFDVASVAAAWETAVSLYSGSYPGYQACNTPYHDLNHVADVFLALTRFIHGAVLLGYPLSERSIVISLVAAIFHDSGLIQTLEDTEGTGAKYLAEHDRRSMERMETFCRSAGWSDSDIEAGRFLIGCTDLNNDVAAISHPSSEIEQLGGLLAAADLIAQMADRVYLEKLLFLYHEFKEGGIGDYTSERDLLQRTAGFYDMVIQRLAPVERMVDRCARRHFAARWQLDINLYAEAVVRQMLYLQDVLRKPGDPRDHLRRQDIVNRVNAFYDGASAPNSLPH